MQQQLACIDVWLFKIIASVMQVFTFGVSASGRLGFRTKFRAQPDTETDISVHVCECFHFAWAELDSENELRF